MNVYEKISAVMRDVSYLSKDDRVETGNGRGYSAITEEKVTGTVRDSLTRHGLVIMPVRQEHTRTDEQVTDKYGNQKINRLSTVNVTYRIQNIEDQTDYIEVMSSGTGVDTQDKGVGKAMTYAYKYMLLRTFAIPTGEDPDKISSELYSDGLTGKPDLKKQAKAKGIEFVAEENAPLTCTQCGKEITGIKYKGETFSPQEQASQWGLCKDCLIASAKKEGAGK